MRATLLALSIIASSASGEESKAPIRMLVGFPAGGIADSAARVLAAGIREMEGQTIVVDNRPGAGGRVAAELLKNSGHDGRTLLLSPIATTIFLPAFAAHLSYDPRKDFVPVSQVATFRLAFAVRAGMPAKTLNEYVAWAKADPKAAIFGSPGVGTPPHFFGLMIGKAAGVQLAHVGYKGGAPLVTDMLGGHIPAGMAPLSDFAKVHLAGKIRILATGGMSRAAMLPDVPTFKELGYDVDGRLWLGAYAPAGTPEAIVQRLSSSIAAVTHKPDVQERVLQLGFELTGTSPEEFAQIIKKDWATWEPIIRASGFKEE